MTRLLLDSTFLIDAERGGFGIDEAISDDDDLAIAAVTVAELLVGVGLASPRHRQRRADYATEIPARGVHCLASIKRPGPRMSASAVSPS